MLPLSCTLSQVHSSSWIMHISLCNHHNPNLKLKANGLHACNVYKTLTIMRLRNFCRALGNEILQYPKRGGSRYLTKVSKPFDSAAIVCADPESSPPWSVSQSAQRSSSAHSFSQDCTLSATQGMIFREWIFFFR